MPKLWRSGHLVVPKALRDKHDIHPGDDVEFLERDGAIVIRKVVRAAGRTRQGGRRGTRGEPTA